jgi:hypothetical protein
MAQQHGGWEGSNTDFKRDLGSKPRDFAKLIKHILAFANTRRRTDAYLIFGVNEDKDRKIFEHVGTQESQFPKTETIDQLLHHYTNLRDVLVDFHYTLDGKRTPYIVIPIQFEGPHKVTHTFSFGKGSITERDIFCRYGSRSVRATDRDAKRMQDDWASWFLDCRYEKNATTLAAALQNRLPKCRQVADIGPCVRLVYDSVMANEFGVREYPVLVHAYWGFEAVQPDAVDKITNGGFSAVYKTIIGSRFDPKTHEAAAAAMVQCVLLDEIYFVNDPYAKLCREFLRLWDRERSSRHLSFIVDLDYQLNAKHTVAFPEHSILTFLEEKLSLPGRSAVLVHGDFGCGKTITAKRLVADLYEEYLRGNVDVPKVLYLNVNGMDIRSRREECLENELRPYHLSAENVNHLLDQIERDEIGLIFDGVDEMAKPYTQAGRKESIDLLRGVVNRRTALYFVRTSYYPELAEMIGNFSLLADHDFQKGDKQTVVAAILGLSKDQVADYLDSRLGTEDAQSIRSVLHKNGLESFLKDPLIVSLLADSLEEEGLEDLREFPHEGGKIAFLGYLISKLLQREQTKRQRYGALAEDFHLFQRVLWAVAFGMVCRSSFSISSSQLDAFVRRAVEDIPGRTPEDVDSFRTMAWIHRSEDGSLAFRHEALTLFCAAQHVCYMLENRSHLGIEDWQSAAPLADVVCDYAGKTIRSGAILGAVAMLGGDIQFNVRLLIKEVLSAARGRTDLQVDHQFHLDERTLAAICRGIAKEVSLAGLPVFIMLEILSEKRRKQVIVILLWLFSRSASLDVAVPVDIVHRMVKRERNFCEDLRPLKEDPGSSFDAMLLRELGISGGELTDSTKYEPLFTRIHDDSSVDTPTRQYADRTLRAIEGERNRRIAAHRKLAR